MKNSLQKKLLLLIACVTCSLVAVLSYLSFNAIQRTSDTARAVSGGALEAQAEQYLLRLTAENASHSAVTLDRTLDEASLLAEIAGGVFSRPEQFLALADPSESQTLVKQPEGQYVDDGSGYASGFAPRSDVPDEHILQDWKLASVMDQLAASVLARNSSAAAAYLVTANDVTRYFSDIRLEGLPPDFKVTEYFLFADAVPNINPERKTRWTEVYDDPAGQGLMVSAIAPIYMPDDAFVGIFGIDFRLADLAQQIENMEIGEASYSFMVNSSGRAIAFPPQAYRDLLGREQAAGEFGVELSGVSGAFSAAVSAMRDGETGMVRVVDGGMEKFLAFAAIPGTDWSLGTVVDSDAVLGAVATLKTRLMSNMQSLFLSWYLPLTLALLLVVGCSALLLTYRLTAPLLQLTRAAENIGARQWDTPLPPAGTDEVGMLSRTLGSMATQLRELIGKLEMRVQERTSELNAALEGLQRSTEEKDRMFEELRTAQRLESIGQLASGVAHEINTPAQYVGDNLEFLRDATQEQGLFLEKCVTFLNALSEDAVDERALGEIKTLKQDIDLDFLVAEIPSAIESSRDGIQQISSIVRSMKDFSHPGAKDKQLVDVNRAIDATVTVAKNEWKYVARIETDLDVELPQIKAHAIEIKQVLLNIIVNAAHAIEKRQNDGSLEALGTIRITTSSNGDRVTVRIRDNGCGIPQDVIDRVYDPFFTTKEVGKGTGQGLSIVHRIVAEQHGGEIRLDSELDNFTEFQLIFPIGDVADVADTSLVA